LRQLTARGHINYDPYSYVTLTEEGERLAEYIARRHGVLAEFLERVLGVDPERADANACRMEHAIDHDVMVRLIEFMEFLDTADPDMGAWMRSLRKERKS